MSNKSGWSMAVMMVAAAVLAMLQLGPAHAEQLGGNGKSAKKPIKVQPFRDAYAKNPKKFDKVYKGKSYYFVSPVTNINDVFGTIGLFLRDDENEVGTQCYLTDNADAAKVAIGQIVVVKAKVRGGTSDVLDSCAVIAVSGEPAAAGSSDVVPLPISDFVAAYRANPAEADARYRDKKMYFSATLRRRDLNGAAPALIVGPAEGDEGLVTCVLEYSTDIDKNGIGQLLVIQATVPGGTGDQLQKCWVASATGEAKAEAVNQPDLGDKGSSSESALPTDDVYAEIIADWGAAYTRYNDKTLFYRGKLKYNGEGEHPIRVLKFGGDDWSKVLDCIVKEPAEAAKALAVAEGTEVTFVGKWQTYPDKPDYGVSIVDCKLVGG